MQVIQSQSLLKAFSGSHCLSAASWHSSGSLASSTLIVLLVTVLEHQQRGERHFTNHYKLTLTKSAWRLNASVIPSGNSHLNSPEVCWTEFVRNQSLECSRKEDDNHHSHLEIQRLQFRLRIKDTTYKSETLSCTYSENAMPLWCTYSLVFQIHCLIYAPQWPTRNFTPFCILDFAAVCQPHSPDG